MRIIRAIIDLEALQEADIYLLKELYDKFIRITFLTDRPYDEVREQLQLLKRSFGDFDYECISKNRYYKRWVDHLRKYNWKLEMVKRYQKDIHERGPFHFWYVPTDFILFYGDKETSRAVATLNDPCVKVYGSLSAMNENVDDYERETLQARMKKKE
jgi:hypothetical protein